MRDRAYKPIFRWVTLGTFVLLGLNQARADVERKALVIIDMQESVLKEWKKTPEVQRKRSALIEKQKQLIDEAKRNKIPILVVQWEGKGPTTTELMKRVGADAAVVEKDKNGFFDGKSAAKAEELLRKRGITDLFFVGIDGGACVEDSIRGALKNHYKVWAVTDGIAEHSPRADRCKQGGAIYPYSYRIWTDDFDPRSCGIQFQPPEIPKLRNQQGFIEVDTDQAKRAMSSVSSATGSPSVRPSKDSTAVGP